MPAEEAGRAAKRERDEGGRFGDARQGGGEIGGERRRQAGRTFRCPGARVVVLREQDQVRKVDVAIAAEIAGPPGVEAVVAVVVLGEARNPARPTTCPTALIP
jgi:hypothetical protein